MMRSFVPSATVSDMGEKALIEEILRPLFNPQHERNLVGDDCAAVEVPFGSFAIASTDRIPADLISFRTGILSYGNLGRYLGVLNLSDVAACGGVPLGLLFNCGLPANLLVEDFVDVSVGFQDIATQFGAVVIGGDITSSSELSLSATVIGHVEKDRILRRSGARQGDSVFVSREIGLTPIALDYCLHKEEYEWLCKDESIRLEAQFTSIEPEIQLGRRLALSGECTSAMDNTDGVGQSLSELARESRCSIVIIEKDLDLTPLVTRAAEKRKWERTSIALGPGADFSLVGTLAGSWTTDKARRAFGPKINVIGTVTAGSGVCLRRTDGIEPLSVEGWNYFRR